MSKTRILVTGGTGYIGSHTTVELINAGFDVVIIDNLSNSNREVLDGIEAITGVRPAFIEGDVNDLSTLDCIFQAYPGIEGIINFAASKAVGESGWLGVLTGGLTATAGGIAAAVLFSFLAALAFRPGEKR